MLRIGLASRQPGDPGLGPGAPSPAAAIDDLPTPEQLAQRFPQLEIIELIGRGGMGVVYRARQKELDRFVAVKILPPAVNDDPAFAQRFTHEAKALAKLNHPNIVTIHDFGQADGLFYFVMELVDGMNLRQLLHAGRIAPREALAIVPQICDALQYAHDAGIVHRDIKPENILLDRRGRVKVADFGLAKLVGRAEPLAAAAIGPDAALTDAGKVVGTPQYMAPEQIERPTEVDHRADIYSLGVVLYQMLTGELPSGDFSPPSEKVTIDVRLDQVVLRAMQQKAELRYQQASDVKTILETIATTPSQIAASARPVIDRQPHRKQESSMPTIEPALPATAPPATDWLLSLFTRGVYTAATAIALLPIFGLGIDPGDPIDRHIARFVECPIAALILAAAGKLLTLLFQFLLMRLHGTPPVAAKPSPSLAKIARFAALYILVAYFAGFLANHLFSEGPARDVEIRKPIVIPGPPGRRTARFRLVRASARGLDINGSNDRFHRVLLGGR
jgi:serine/threonine protein kinase